MKITIKLGGTSVGTGGRIRAAAQFLAGVRAQGHQIAVVTSAMTTVTDSLVALADRGVNLEADDVGVVGERVTEVAGILATVTRSLEKVRATPLVLLQGASPNSIVTAVEDRQEILKLALQQLHDDLGLTRPLPVLSLTR